MTYCQNCGHNSHCGAPLWREERDYDDEPYQIKVCEHCRCKECQPLKDNNKS